MKNLGQDVELTFSERNDTPDAALISEKLRLYIEEKFGLAHKKTFVAIIRTKDQEFLAGLKGYSHWGWLYIVHLWVDEGMRSKGLGKALLRAAEDQARVRGARGVYVDTFEASTRDFYVKAGFKEVGSIKDFPVGTSRYFLAKHI